MTLKENNLWYKFEGPRCYGNRVVYCFISAMVWNAYRALLCYEMLILKSQRHTASQTNNFSQINKFFICAVAGCSVRVPWSYGYLYLNVGSYGGLGSTFGIISVRVKHIKDFCLNLSSVCFSFLFLYLTFYYHGITGSWRKDWSALKFCFCTSALSWLPKIWSSVSALPLYIDCLLLPHFRSILTVDMWLLYLTFMSILTHGFHSYMYNTVDGRHWTRLSAWFICLFVWGFTAQSTLFRSCLSRSVNTLFLGRLTSG